MYVAVASVYNDKLACFQAAMWLQWHTGGLAPWDHSMHKRGRNKGLCVQMRHVWDTCRPYLLRTLY